DVKRSARLSVAPMMDWTDRHCRYLHRQLTRRALLYTEMVTAAALVRGRALHLLDFDVREHPVALQLGGSDPDELAQAARLGEQAGYAEINLNVGCPSDRVQSGTFGAVLMKDPARVAACCTAMRAAVSVEITVKCRIGVDDDDPSQTLPDFLAQISDAGMRRVTVHARKAWLKGLSPKENREIPPLDYPLVADMRRLFPGLHLSINGGVTSLDEAQSLLESGFDGVMVGRAAYQNPVALLGAADRRIFGASGPDRSAHDAVLAMLPYIEAHLVAGGKLHQITRHMLGLFNGQPGARAWRRLLSEGASAPTAGVDLVERAHAQVQELAA
ncbi:MAG: tRNA dihydrouridine(20/20a) synthase DusA, partial [Pseudomonadota bacterium]